MLQEQKFIQQFNELRRKGAKKKELSSFLSPIQTFSLEMVTLILPTLIEFLGDPDWMIRFEATLILAKIGPRAKAAITALERTLQHDSKVLVREYAVEALGKIALSSSVPKFLTVLKQTKVLELGIREKIIIALGNFKDQAAIPSLLEVLYEPEEFEFNKQAAVFALGQITKELDAKSFESALTHYDHCNEFETSYQAGVILSPFDLNVASSIFKLASFHQHPNPVVRQKVIEAYGCFKAKSSETAPILIRLFKTDPSEEVRFEILLSLHDLVCLEESIEVLLLALTDPYSPIQLAAISIIREYGREKKLGKKTPQVVQALLERVVKKEEENISSKAIEALGDIGKEAKSAIPVLEKLRYELDEELLKPLNKVLRKLKETKTSF